MGSNLSVGKRIFYLDQLRALAIIAIVFCHVSNLWNGSADGSFNWIVHYFFNIFGRFGVPVFLMLSGALLLNKNYAIYDFMKRRFPRILKPFIFWMLIAILFGIIAHDKFSYFSSISLTVVYLAKTFLTSRWYVWMIIGVYFAMPIINDFVKNRGLKGIEYFLLLWLITSILLSISLYFDISMYYLDLSLFAGPLGYVLLGYYLHNKEFNVAPDKLLILGFLMFASAVVVKTILVYMGYFDPSLFRYYIFQTKSHLEIDILAILEATGVFLMIKYLNSSDLKGLAFKISSFLKKGIIGRLTVSLSRYSYGIYLNHYLSLGVIGILGLNLLKHSALKWIPMTVLIVLLVSGLLILIVDKIPYLNKFSGSH